MKSFSPGTVIAGVLLLGGGVLLAAVPLGLIMGLLGASFGSLSGAAGFFLLTAALGVGAERLAKGLPQALMKLGRLDRRPAQVLYVALDTLGSCAAMLLAGALVPGVVLTGPAVLAVSLGLALVGVRDLLPEERR